MDKKRRKCPDPLLKRKNQTDSLKKRQQRSVTRSHSQQRDDIEVSSKMSQSNSSFNSSSDIIEDSDHEVQISKRKKPTIVLDSSSESTDDINTSMICLPRTHNFFGQSPNSIIPPQSPLKSSRSTTEKIHILDNKIVQFEDASETVRRSSKSATSQGFFLPVDINLKMPLPARIAPPKQNIFLNAHVESYSTDSALQRSSVTAVSQDMSSTAENESLSVPASSLPSITAEENGFNHLLVTSSLNTSATKDDLSTTPQVSSLLSIPVNKNDPYTVQVSSLPGIPAATDAPSTAPVSLSPSIPAVKDSPSTAPVSSSPSISAVKDAPSTVPVSSPPSIPATKDAPSTAPFSSPPSVSANKKNPSTAPFSSPPSAPGNKNDPFTTPVSSPPSIPANKNDPFTAPVSSPPSIPAAKDAQSTASVSSPPSIPAVEDAPYTAPVSLSPSILTVKDASSELKDALISSPPSISAAKDAPSNAPICSPPSISPAKDTQSSVPLNLPSTISSKELDTHTIRENASTSKEIIEVEAELENPGSSKATLSTETSNKNKRRKRKKPSSSSRTSNDSINTSQFDQTSGIKKAIQENNHPRPKRKRTKDSNLAYIDFLSDKEEDPFSSGSSDYWSAGESNESKQSNSNKRRKKKNAKKNRQKSEKLEKKVIPENKLKKNKILKDKGLEYKTRKNITMESKSMKKNPCDPEHCHRGCFNITEERRQSLFDFFWALSPERRKDWIVRCTRQSPIRRKRTKCESSKRTVTYDYYINDGEDHKKVCQKFLINTLDITQKFILYTISKAHEGVAQKDMRKPNNLPKYSEEEKSRVEKFIENLPAVPSHYKRKTSDKRYLPQELRNVSNLYRIYTKECKKEGTSAVSENIFRGIFNTFNISFHCPKKDKCTLCVKFEHSQELSENDKKIMIEHREEKDATYTRFLAHQNIKPEDRNTTVTASFDLQKVLNTPYGDSMLLYYSRKYAVFNFTVYESGTQNGYCFTWGECDAKRGSNEIATCLHKYLEAVDERGVKNLILYCDSCGGQNKNKTVLAILNKFLITSKNLEVIQINFLLPGHTYMPADSMHATIENEVRKLIIWAPSQWPTYFESARKNPRPYTVDTMEYSDFLNWDEIANKTFSTEMIKKMKTKEIRVATFKKSKLDTTKIKYSMKPDTPEIIIEMYTEQKGKGKGKGKGKNKAKSNDKNENWKKVKDIKPSSLYQSRLPISVAKFKDLKRLCDTATIPKRFHNEYLQLPNEAQVLDVLIESDEEDDEINAA